LNANKILVIGRSLKSKKIPNAFRVSKTLKRILKELNLIFYRILSRNRILSKILYLIFKIISTILLMTCILCEKNSVEFWFGSLCAKCRRVKHLLSIFNERVYEVLEEVLIKNEDEQDVKIKEELKIELTKNEYNLRNKKKNTTE
tara:strand:- start:816 stop:1250 length:435 start_codon:yes stop_codon:yes gene_type:complete